MMVEAGNIAWMVGKETVGAARTCWQIKQSSLLVVCLVRRVCMPLRHQTTPVAV